MPALKKYLAAYLATIVVLLVLDGLWLGLLAMPLYQQGIGHLMAAQPNFVAAVAFYLVYAAGLLVFAVVPRAAQPGWRSTALAAAFFGCVAYATYDLSNLATLRDWPVGLSLLDILWGSLLSAAAATAGKRVLGRGKA